MFTSIIVMTLGFIVAVIYSCFEAEINTHLINLSTKEIEKEIPKKLDKETAWKLCVAHRKAVLKKAEETMWSDMINNRSNWEAEMLRSNGDRVRPLMAELVK